MENPLFGTWSLLGWYNQTDEGEKLYPLGDDATGYISYSSDGFVFVHIMASNRVNFAVNDPFGGSIPEDSRAFKSHITYAGRYEFQGHRVIHPATQASCPNWIGTEQIREVEFPGETLRLIAAGATFQGYSVTAFVDWERATTS